MNQPDRRWVRRFNNFVKAFAQLEDAVKLSRQRELSKLEQQGLIQAFEYTHELAWKTMKDFLEERGVQNIYGSRDATREAFKAGLIENGEVWMEMIQSCHLTSHTYNEETAAIIFSAIADNYFAEFAAFRERMEQHKASEEPSCPRASA